MLTSITPLGERGRARRWSLTVSAYVVAGVLGGATAGALLGGAGAALRALLGSPPAGAVLGIAAVVCMLAALADRRGRTWPPRRQVDEDWLLRYRGWVTGIGFGYQLGLGVATIVTSASVYAVLLLAAATQSVAAGTLVGAVLGLARVLPALGLRRVTTPDALHRLSVALERWAPAGARLAVGALLVAGAVLGAGAVAGGVG